MSNAMVAGVGSCVPGASVPEVKVNTSVYAQITSPTQRKVHESWEIALKMVFYIVLFVLNLIGNILIIVIVILNRKMRTTTNLLILNMAVSDLLVGLVCMSTHLGNQITSEWPFGEFLCKFNFFTQVLVLVSSVFTLTVLSVERFMVVVYPFKKKWTFTNVGVISLCIWVLSFSVAYPQLIVRKLFQIQWKDRHQVWCQQVWPKVYKDAQCNVYEPSKIAYYCIKSILIFFLPIAIMIGAYTNIIYTLIKKDVACSYFISITYSRARERGKRKTIKMLVTVVIVFVLCWTPQQVLLLWDIFRNRESTPDMHVVSYIALYVAYINSAVNPIMYAGFNDKFRHGFAEVFHVQPQIPHTNQCVHFQQERSRITVGTVDNNTSIFVTGVDDTYYETTSDPQAAQDEEKPEPIPTTSAQDSRIFFPCLSFLNNPFDFDFYE